ncbi:hypothetical protein PENTCL1PPCAC_18320 [Pristionchus entomophagus]|uniref:G protein-coupled receptor n=1 Tax=Pristionchus entomophagus TaxID=358040 RepID=A0AAV5TP11_9BILA|nr:hypothetical protein PENTCL1PPCAC_18320 [Pristionchus entomophagus]
MGVKSENAAVLTPEERRERRRAKILASSDHRLARILSGPDGGERRMAPAMEGGEFRASSIADSTSDEKGREQAPVLNVEDISQMPSLVEMGVKFEPPRLFTFVRTARCKVVSVIALLFFILSTLDVISSVLLPWSILFVSYSIVEKKQCISPYPNHGYIVNGLMWVGFSENVVVNLGHLLEGMSSYMADTATLLFIFLVASATRDAILLLTS